MTPTYRLEDFGFSDDTVSLLPEPPQTRTVCILQSDAWCGRSYQSDDIVTDGVAWAKDMRTLKKQFLDALDGSGRYHGLDVSDKFISTLRVSRVRVVLPPTEYLRVHNARSLVEEFDFDNVRARIENLKTSHPDIEIPDIAKIPDFELFRRCRAVLWGREPQFRKPSMYPQPAPDVPVGCVGSTFDPWGRMVDDITFKGRDSEYVWNLCYDFNGEIRRAHELFGVSKTLHTVPHPHFFFQVVDPEIDAASLREMLRYKHDSLETRKLTVAEEYDAERRRRERRMLNRLRKVLG